MNISTTYLSFLSLLLAILIGYLVWSGTSIQKSIVLILVFVLTTILHLLWNVIRSMMPSTSRIELRGANVVITGGSSGIGLSLGKCLAGKGAHIVLVARNEERLKKAVKVCEDARTSESNTIQYKCINITGDPSEVRSRMDEIAKDLGSVDVLVNCAGTAVPGEFAEVPAQDFADMMNTNYLGAVHMTHAAVGQMKKRRFGQVVFVSSLAGQLAVYGYSAYSASKFALRGLAEALTHELTCHNIGVTVVYPADTDTPGFSEENKRKPLITKLISEEVGLSSADDVAEAIIHGLEARSRTIVVGSDGFFLHALTCGASLPSSIQEFLAQVVLMPILRVYMLFLQNSFLNTIRANNKLS